MASWQAHDDVTDERSWTPFEGEGTVKEQLAIMHFNRGAELCLIGRSAEALAELSRAIELDTTCANTALADDAWAALWEDPRFNELVFCEEAPMAQRSPMLALN